MKRPSFQFYPGDWLNDAALRMVSVGARGLWIEMLCYMHQGSPYGHLKVNSKVITEIQLARMVGGELGEVKNWLHELADAGVYAVADDGAMLSRRMVKDEELREVRAAGGKEGGNPKLMGGYNKPGFVYAMLRANDGAVKIGISQDPAKRLYKVRTQYPGIEINVIGKLYVEDMGASEAALHERFSHCKDGEWFALTDAERSNLLNVHLKVKSKAKDKASKTPSSSSSSSVNSVTNVTGAEAPQPLTAHESIFRIGIPWLVANGAKESNVRSMLGGAVKKFGDGEAWAMMQDCMREEPVEPVAWLAKAINTRGPAATAAASQPKNRAQARHDGLDAAAAEFAARMAAKGSDGPVDGGYVPPDDGNTFEME